MRRILRSSFQSLMGSKPPEEKRSRFSTVLSYHGLGQPRWTGQDFQTQVLSGYQKNAIVYRCVTLITRSLSAVPLLLYKKGERLMDHPLLALLKQPNPLQNYASFCESVLAYLLLDGNSFVEAVTSGLEIPIPQELYCLRPDRMSIIPGHNGYPEAYEYRLGASAQRVSIDPLTGHCPIMHMKLFNPLDDHRGMSPLHAAQHSVDLQNTISSHNLALLQNAGCPSGALLVKGNHLTQKQTEELRTQLDQLKGNGAGNMLLLEGDFEWKEMGLSPKDMDFHDGKNSTARDIAQIFGIPPMCIGILGDSTYSNYQESRLHLWEDTLLPLLDSFLAHLTHWMQPWFGDDIRLSYNKDDIHALIPRREKMWDSVNRITCLTVNEKRKIMGYDPLDGGDVLPVGIERSALTASEES